ncbi:MAG: hypothetical protein M1812_000829 [Candelaria pacifica]|nr:MAG: hypothetical protein M1812_000829 [Candelaria pacifica]
MNTTDECNKEQKDAPDVPNTRPKDMPCEQVCYECWATKPAYLFFDLGICFECRKKSKDKAPTPQTPESNPVVLPGRNLRNNTRQFNPYHRQQRVRGSSKVVSSRTGTTARPGLHHENEDDRQLSEELRAASRKAQREILNRKIAEATTLERKETTAAREHEDKLKALAIEEAEIVRKEAEIVRKKADIAKDKEVALSNAAVALRQAIRLKEKLAEVDSTE